TEYSDSPSLYLTWMTPPSGDWLTVPTVALVITPSGLTSHGRWPSPVPRSVSGKMRTSTAWILPSVPLTPPEARKSPGLMSATVRFSTPNTAALSASTTVTGWPSVMLTVRLLPSSLSTVPTTRIGAPWGGVCARAGTARSAAKTAAIYVGCMIRHPPLEFVGRLSRNHVEPASAPDYIGGLTPSFSAVTDAAVNVPSACLRATMKIAVPGFSRAE